MTAKNDDLLNSRDASELAGIPYSSFLGHRADGRIPATKSGNSWMFKLEDVERLKEWADGGAPTGRAYVIDGEEQQLFSAVDAGEYLGISAQYFNVLAKRAKIVTATPDRDKNRLWHPEDVESMKAQREGKTMIRRKRKGHSNGANGTSGTMRGIDKVITATKCVREWQDGNDMELTEAEEFSLIERVTNVLIKATA